MKNLIIKSILLTSVLILTLSCSDRNESDATDTTVNNSILKSSNSSEPFGTYDNEEFVIFNETQLIEQIDNFINENQGFDFESNVESLYFEYVNLGETDNQVLHLVADDLDNNTLTAFVINVENNFLSFSPSFSSLSCSGCRDGCSPRRKENGDGYCTKCTAGTLECSKTESEDTISFLP